MSFRARNVGPCVKTSRPESRALIVAEPISDAAVVEVARAAGTAAGLYHVELMQVGRRGLPAR